MQVQSRVEKAATDAGCAAQEAGIEALAVADEARRGRERRQTVVAGPGVYRIEVTRGRKPGGMVCWKGRLWLMADVGGGGGGGLVLKLAQAGSSEIEWSRRGRLISALPDFP